MSNWIIITADHVKAAGHGAIVDGAGTLATGGIDPVAQEIAAAVARVRRACSAANTLDQDTRKVPASLVGVTARIALYGLMRRIGDSLSDDERAAEKNDNSDLNRIADHKLRVEAPDVPAGAGEMQEPGAAIAAVNVPVRLTGREKASGL